MPEAPWQVLVGKTRLNREKGQLCEGVRGMFTFMPLRAQDYDEALELMQKEMLEYLLEVSRALGLSWKDFSQIFRSRGQTFGIYHNDQLAGFWWIEERDDVVHLHALVIKEAYRGQGLGTKVLKQLETEFAGRKKAIELGVHRSNHRAKRLYEKMGYQVVASLSDLGFYIMQRTLSNAKT